MCRKNQSCWHRVVQCAEGMLTSWHDDIFFLCRKRLPLLCSLCLEMERAFGLLVRMILFIASDNLV